MKPAADPIEFAFLQAGRDHEDATGCLLMRSSPPRGARACRWARRLLPLTILLSTAASAMSLRDAGENLLYLEHASIAADHCQQRGFPVRPAYEAWARANAGLRAGTADAIRLHAARGGLSAPEQEGVLKEALETQRELAAQHIATKGVNCKDFDASLRMYSSLMKR